MVDIYIYILNQFNYLSFFFSLSNYLSTRQSAFIHIWNPIYRPIYRFSYIMCTRRHKKSERPFRNATRNTHFVQFVYSSIIRWDRKKHLPSKASNKCSTLRSFSIRILPCYYFRYLLNITFNVVISEREISSL